ncbi:Nucleoporin p58/p45 [Podila humilis]|nr:Nucleoporin p58/p45 [Podila humilis]
MASLFQGFGPAPAASGSSLFGAAPAASAPASSAPASGSNLFGTAPATGSSLFGAAPLASTPASGSSLFGAAPATVSTAGPSLFGAAPAASTPASTSSLFGATPAPATGSSLFGGPPATSASLYPSLTASTASTASSLFSSAPTTSFLSTPNSQAASSTLLNAAGRTTLGTSSASASSVPLTPDTIALSTKYTELPADAKSALDQFHTFLQTQVHLSSTLTSRPSDSLDKISKDTTELSKRLTTLKDALDRDSKAVQALQDRVGQELKQADSAGRIIEAYGNTSLANFLYAGNNSAGQYFEEQCQSYESQLRQFRTTIEDIERHLASFNTRNPHVAHALTEVLRNQHNGFLAVAGQVALLHDEIKSKEKAYLMFRRKYFDDDTDPFQAAIKHHRSNNMHSHSMANTHSHAHARGPLSEGQQSFREFAKQSLRPASATSAAAPAGATGGNSAGSSSLFGPGAASSTSLGKPLVFGGFGSSTAPSTSTSTPAFSLTPSSAPAPATSTAGSSLFGAPPTSSLFGAPATSTPASSLFGAPAANTATPFGFKQ